MADTRIESVSNAIPGSARQLLWYAVYAIVGFIALLAFLGQIASCTGTRSSSSGAVNLATGTITLNLAQEPPQLDSTKATDQVSGMILGHVMEGLLRYDANDDLIAGVAETWSLTDTEAHFTLKQGLTWSNGTPITANDFVFSWRKAVDPKTASQYAFILYFIENAREITKGELPPESLGVSAVDDFTLHVRLSEPTPFFLSLMAFPTYFPINEAFFESTNGRYGANASDLIYNGPFTIAQWVHNANVRLEKNTSYWNKDAVNLNTIDFAYILSDANAIINLFESGDIAYAGLNAELIDRALRNHWDIRQHVDGSVFFIEVNHRPERLTSNYNLRKALQYVNDPSELVNKIIKLPGNLPGESIFPVWLKGVNGKFREEYPPKPLPTNHDKAREHYALALKELGYETLPPLVMLSGDNPSAHKQSEYYQSKYATVLGLDLKLDRQIFKQRLQKMTDGDFDLVLAGWGPDYADALTFGDLFTSWNENNRGRYNSPEVDRHVDIAKNSSDPATRMAAFSVVQDLLNEDVAILNNYERGSLYVLHPNLKGVVRRSVGADPDYAFAYIEEPES